MQVLKAANIHHDFGVRPLFDGLELVLNAGDRIGLIGPNGCGKSTLLKILAGLVAPLEGTLTRPRPVKAAYLPQDPEFRPGTSIYGALQESLADLAGLKERYEEVTEQLKSGLDRRRRAELTALAQRLHDQLDTRGGWDLSPRIEEIATRLRLPPTDTLLDQQSGGTIKRVALGQALLAEPELLFLDEPTNHLDTETVSWLENRLKNFSGTLVLVTHDRYFLEAVVGRIVEVSAGRLVSYPGNYTAYLEAKRKEWELLQRADEKRLKTLAREIEWLKSGVRARTHKSKARIERVRKLARQRRAQKDKPVELHFDPQTRLGRTILTAHRLHKAFEGNEVIRDFSLELLGDERIGVIGPNGCGKTTLVRLLIGELEPDSGFVKHGINTRIAYFDQNREQLDPKATIWDSVQPGGDHVLVSSRRLHKKAFLESFLFPAEIQRFRVELLSGGERNRLLLARLMLAGANVLVLDEPTNDLDLPTLEVLEEQLGRFKGSLIMVTHDRYFLDRVADQLYAFEPDGTIRNYPGNYSFYLKCREEERGVRRAETQERKAEQAEQRPKREFALHYLEKRELKGIEERILEAEKALAEARVLLEDGSIASDASALTRAFEQAREREAEVGRLYERWEELEHKRDHQE